MGMVLCQPHQDSTMPRDKSWRQPGSVSIAYSCVDVITCGGGGDGRGSGNNAGTVSAAATPV